MRWDEAVIGQCVRIMDAASPLFGVNDVIVGTRADEIGVNQIILLVASKKGIFFHPSQLSVLPNQKFVGKLVYVIKPHSQWAHNWNSNGMDRYYRTFHLVESQNGGGFRLFGVNNWIFFKQWLMPVRKTDGRLNNEYRNRCFVCGHSVVGRDVCTYCNASYVSRNLKLS